MTRVYFFVAPALHLVRIGYSSLPTKRIKHLQTWSPVDLVLAASVPGGRYVESWWHHRFADCRVRGEWFVLAPEIKAAIATIKEIGTFPSMPCESVVPSAFNAIRPARRFRALREKMNVSLEEIAAGLNRKPRYVKVWDRDGIPPCNIPAMIAFAEKRGVHLTPADFWEAA